MTIFYLNRESVPRRVVSADTTVLEYLRNDGLTGSKEGCASGDCGACTAVIAGIGNDGKTFFRSINACLALLSAIDGKWLITVEGLKKDNRLHAVQEAMIHTHASQCGFCTPGFVMSLFAFAKGRKKKDKIPRHTQREQVTQAISGNLCRCTGYRPIIDAALTLPEDCGNDGYSSATVRQKIRELRSTADRTKTIMQMAKNIAENPTIPLVAGGTDLSLRITQQLTPLEKLIPLTDVSPLDSIHTGKTFWRIGAATNWETVDAILGKSLPSLSAMLKRFGSPQIRYLGTVGGNIANASPVADGPPVWLVLNATLILRRGSVRRQLAIHDFFLDYKKTALASGEWIEAIKVPHPLKTTMFRVYKVSKRWHDDISSVLLAFSARVNKQGHIEQLRIAGGGLAAIPKRAFHTEKLLTNQRWDDYLLRQAISTLDQDFSPISDMRASARYRRQVSANLLYRFAHEVTTEHHS